MISMMGRNLFFKMLFSILFTGIVSIICMVECVLLNTFVFAALMVVAHIFTSVL